MAEFSVEERLGKLEADARSQADALDTGFILVCSVFIFREFLESGVFSSAFSSPLVSFGITLLFFLRMYAIAAVVDKAAHKSPVVSRRTPSLV